MVCVDAPIELRRERVMARNAAGGEGVQVVPPEFFELASRAWEPPTQAERARWAWRDVVP